MKRLEYIISRMVTDNILTKNILRTHEDIEDFLLTDTETILYEINQQISLMLTGMEIPEKEMLTYDTIQEIVLEELELHKCDTY